MAVIKLDPRGTQRVWVGTYGIRKWTVPIDDCVAYPTRDFYRNRHVLLSDEGSRYLPRWVALDRYNDSTWSEDRYDLEECLPYQDLPVQGKTINEALLDCDCRSTESIRLRQRCRRFYDLLRTRLESLRR